MKSGLSPKSRALLAKTLSHPLLWIGLSATVLFLDWLTDPAISFPLVYIFPVGLAAFHRGFRWGASFAAVLPILRFCSALVRETPWPFVVSVLNLGIRVTVLCGFAWLIARSVTQQRLIKSLERLLPICAWCGKMRTEQNSWQRLDTYLAARTDLSFTHTICSECAAKQLPQT